MFLHQTKTKAFTLVELIVVITILAILATIAFTSLQGYSKDARNSTRISDTSNVKLALELYILQTGKYPLPGNAVDITGTGGVILWKKGTIDTSVITKLQKISTLPTDPKTETEMEYATTLNQKEYEIKYNLELAASPSPVRRGIGVRGANAADTTPYVQGTYNGLYLLGDDNNYYAVPGLHTSSGITVSIPVSFDLNNKIIDNYQVIQLNHSGALTSSNLKDNYLNFGLALKAAYATTPELNSGIYAVVAGLDNTTAEKFAKEITTGTYQAPVVVLGDLCGANPSYSTGSMIGTYNIPEITDTQIWTGTGNVTENNGVFQYTLNLTCSNGVYTNQIETGPVLQSCDGGYSPNVNICEDTSPDIFTFTDQIDVNTSTVISSNIITPIGYGVAISVSISGSGTPQLSINGGAWDTSGTISPGNTLQIRLTSSSSNFTANSATVTMGGVSDNWSITTKNIIIMQMWNAQGKPGYCGWSTAPLYCLSSNPGTACWNNVSYAGTCIVDQTCPWVGEGGQYNGSCP